MEESTSETQGWKGWKTITFTIMAIAQEIIKRFNSKIQLILDILNTDSSNNYQ